MSVRFTRLSVAASHSINSETGVPRVRGDGAFIVAEHKYFGGIHKRLDCDGRTCARVAVSPTAIAHLCKACVSDSCNC